MRTNEFTGVYHMMDEISPEAFKAQRLQELKDLAEWRARHLAQITAWSSEEKRLERQAQHLADDLEARRIANERVKEDPNYILSLMSAKGWSNNRSTNFMTSGGPPIFEKLGERISITEIIKTVPKKSWWQKLWRR